LFDKAAADDGSCCNTVGQRRYVSRCEAADIESAFKPVGHGGNGRKTRACCIMVPMPRTSALDVSTVYNMDI